VVAIYFSATPDVSWMRLECPEEIPEEFRRELFQVEAQPAAPFGIALREV
jgi:hypothetical protein